MKKLIALTLVLCLMLSGCALDLGEYFRELGMLLGSFNAVAFEDMEYTRPDKSIYRDAVDAVYGELEKGSDVETLMDSVFGFYEQYHSFYTSYALANIHYSKDLTDLYWEEEYNYCIEFSAEVDASFDQLLYALADCPLKQELEAEEYFGEGFFDYYEGESLWDETFTAMMAEEAELQSRYYELSAEALSVPALSEEFFNRYGSRMAQLYVELIALRQKIAAYAGYEDYPSFAYEFYYYRDYTPTQAQSYMASIQQELVPLYRTLAYSDVWHIAARESTEEQTFSYAQSCAKAMGGTVEEAFYLMKNANLYDISYGENKFAASFEVFLSSYGEPYIFMNPTTTVQDQLTFVHEFGHFCNDYATFGGKSSVDVAEVFSQGLEYLSLCYCEDTEDLRKLKMADSLCIYVEQSVYASFEQQAYALEGEDLTVENLYAIYEATGKAYGLDIWNWDRRSFVAIQHFYTAPLYIISYVVSNDAALQLFQMEQAEAGAGLALYGQNLTTQEAGFLAFTEAAGLESPFAEGRVASVRKTMEEVLK